MSRKETIEHLLRALNPHFLSVEDKSSDHIGHAGNPMGAGQTHFSVTISAASLKSYTKIEQHRIINSLLKEEFDKGLHALSITIIN